MMHMLVKDKFLHNEFGIKAGRCSRSCLPTHRTKTGIKIRLIVNSAITLGCRIEEDAVEIILSGFH